MYHINLSQNGPFPLTVRSQIYRKANSQYFYKEKMRKFLFGKSILFGKFILIYMELLKSFFLTDMTNFEYLNDFDFCNEMTN